MTKKENNKELSKDELEEILNDEELIDELEESEEPKININENQFREFLQTESTLPVLEEIAEEQELNGKVFFTPGMDANVQDDDKAFRYDAQTQEDGTKYQGDSSLTNQNLKELDITKVGRDIGQPQVKEAGFVHSAEQTDSLMQEKYQEAQKIDMGKVGRENPFESRIQEVEEKKSEYIIK